MTDKKFIKKVNKLFKKKFGKDLHIGNVDFGMKHMNERKFVGGVIARDMTLFFEAQAYITTKETK